MRKERQESYSLRTTSQNLGHRRHRATCCGGFASGFLHQLWSPTDDAKTEDLGLLYLLSLSSGQTGWDEWVLDGHSLVSYTYSGTESDSKKEDLVSLVSKYRYHGFYKYHKCATAILDAGHEAGSMVRYNTWVESSECIGARSTTLLNKYNFLSFVPEVSI